MVVLLDEIRSCQDILNRITDMKLGYLGTALVTVTNQVCCRHCTYFQLINHGTYWIAFTVSGTFSCTYLFLDPESGSQKATVVVLLVVVSSVRLQKSLKLS